RTCTLSLHDALPISVRDEFRVPATERFGNVAVPANGPVGGQGLLKMFQRNLIPLEAVALLVYDGGRMIMPMDFAKRPVTVKASPADRKSTRLNSSHL